ncbi:MAG: glycosyltransferase, partial [bacterium]
GEKYLSPCLTSVLAQNFKDFSVLMIDNGSSDGTRGEIEKWKDIFEKEGIKARTIFLDKNIGFAGGHNLGIKEMLRGKNPPISPFKKGGNIRYVCCLNQDIILRPEFFRNIVEFMDAHLDCGSASGKLMSVRDDLFYANKRELESLPAQAGEYTRKTSPNHSLSRRGTMDYDMLEKEFKIIDSVGLKIFRSQRVIEKGQGEEDTGQYDKIEEVFGVSGAAPVYRIEALEDVKIPHTDHLLVMERELFEYFDEDFFSYKEDVDLAYRLRWRGWKSFTIPEAVAYHKRTAKDVTGRKSDFFAALNRKNKSKFANYHSQRNQLFLLVKNLPKLNFAVIWYEVKKFIYELIFEWSTFKAWIDTLKKIRVMLEKRRWIMGNKKIEDEEMGKWF